MSLVAPTGLLYWLRGKVILHPRIGIHAIIERKGRLNDELSQTTIMIQAFFSFFLPIVRLCVKAGLKADAYYSTHLAAVKSSTMGFVGVTLEIRRHNFSAAWYTSEGDRAVSALCHGLWIRFPTNNEISHPFKQPKCPVSFSLCLSLFHSYVLCHVVIHWSRHRYVSSSARHAFVLKFPVLVFLHRQTKHKPSHYYRYLFFFSQNFGFGRKVTRHKYTTDFVTVRLY